MPTRRPVWRGAGRAVVVAAPLEADGDHGRAEPAADAGADGVLAGPGRLGLVVDDAAPGHAGALAGSGPGPAPGDGTRGRRCLRDRAWRV